MRKQIRELIQNEGNANLIIFGDVVKEEIDREKRIRGIK